MSEMLKITEIFFSLQGESSSAGRPTIFIRLTGCPLRCGYCDTSYAFSGGELRVLGDILEEIKQWDCRWVTVTGGEPLAQPACRLLLDRLCDLNYQVSLETSGALDVSGIEPRVSVVMDLKTPGSGELHSNRYQNIEHLRSHDQLKFVICDRCDYDWARLMMDTHNLPDIGCEILFSAAHDQMQGRQLADWILSDKLDVRFQVQLHKILWGDKPGV